MTAHATWVLEADVHKLLPDWRDLAQESAVAPWSDPDLVLAWAEVHRVHELRLLVVRDDQRLVAVAPFYLRRIAVGGRVLQLVGTGVGPVLTELPEILVRPGLERPALAAVVQALGAASTWFDWAELPLTQQQGWYEEAWGRGPHRLKVVHKTQRPCVVLDLTTDDWTADLPPTKRNLRESVRRSRNRLAHTAPPGEVVVTAGAASDWLGAVEDLVRLHRQRARLGGIPHPDVFRHTSARALLVAFGGRSAHAELEVWRARAGERVVAALLTARDRRTLWIAMSGMDEIGAECSAVTYLQHRAIQQAAQDGLRRVVLSVGVDTHKLRWSDHVENQQEFLLLGRRPGAAARLYAFWLLRALHVLRQQLRR